MKNSKYFLNLQSFGITIKILVSINSFSVKKLSFEKGIYFEPKKVALYLANIH
jgi:hypothetical protein